MLGHRGCRLGNTYPEITEMQTRAIIEAALNTCKNKGIDVHVEIMVPLVGTRERAANTRKTLSTLRRRIGIRRTQLTGSTT